MKAIPWQFTHVFWGALVSLVAAITPIPHYPGAHVPPWLAWLATLTIAFAKEYSEGDLMQTWATRGQPQPAWWPFTKVYWQGVRDIALFLPVPSAVLLISWVHP